MKFLLIFILLLSELVTAFSQSIKTDTVTDIQVKNALALYNNYTGSNAPIYSGTDYLYFYFKMEGDPFFATINLTKGWVSYSGRMYNPISTGYDINRNQVTIASPDNFARIVLQNELVDSFNVSGHTFIRVAEDHEQNLYNSGFYDLLYNGNVQVLARRIKTLQEVVKDVTIVRVFNEKDRWYIHKGKEYYQVSNKKDVFNVLGDKKHELKKTMRRNHYKFGRKNFETTLIATAGLYDQLIH